MIKKNLISILLAVCMLASVPLTAGAAEETPDSHAVQDTTSQETGEQTTEGSAAQETTEETAEDSTAQETTEETIMEDPTKLPPAEDEVELVFRGVPTGSKPNIYCYIKMAEGGNAAYAIVTAEGYVTTEGATAENYNIKFEYPVGGVPTLSLKDAHIQNALSGGSGIRQSPRVRRNFDLNILVESDSSVFSNSSCLHFTRGNVTISSVGSAKLSMESQNSSAISVSAIGIDYDVTLKNAVVDLRSSLQYSIHNKGDGDINISDSKVVAQNALWHCLFASGGDVMLIDSRVTATTGDTPILAAGSITLQKSVVSATGINYSLSAGKTIAITDSTVYLCASSRKNETVHTDEGFTIENSYVEIVAKEATVFAEQSIPTLQGGYTAVAGEHKYAVDSYDPAVATTYKYFWIKPGPLPEVDPDNDPDETIEDTATEDTTIDETTEDTTAETTSETTEDTIAEDTTAENTTETSVPTESSPLPTDSSKRGRTAIGIVIIVLLLGAGVGVTVAFIKKNLSA